MILLLAAVLAGGGAGVTRAWLGKRALALPDLSMVWLVLVAYVPQWLAFRCPFTRDWVTDDTWAAIALVSSQCLLLLFAVSNRRLPGFRWLCLGLMLNLLVIVLNGGLMPISPETVRQLRPPEVWEIGHRLKNSRDIVLAVEATRLWWLSDCIVWISPLWRVAFSLGDVFIAGGAFGLLWALGGRSRS